MQDVQQLEGQLSALEAKLGAAGDTLLQSLQRGCKDAAGEPLMLHESKAQLLAQHTVHEAFRYLCSLVQTQQYVRDVQELVDLVRFIEKSTRGATKVLAAQDVDGFLTSAMELAELHQRAEAAETSASCSPTAGHELYPLQRMVGAAQTRLQATREWLVSSLQSQFQVLAGECGWPPPLVGAAQDGSQGVSGTCFALANPRESPVHARWMRVMEALTTVQVAVEGSSFQPVLQGSDHSIADLPLLWVAQQLAEPVQTWLEAHFNSSLATGRLDKPEWLLSTVVKVTKQLGPLLDDLQTTLTSAGIGKDFHITMEFARAMREAVRNVLRTVKLPEVEASGQPALWLHMVNSMVSFEEKMAPFLGIFLKGEKTLPFTVLRGSTLALFCENQTWLTCWMEAEQFVLQSQLEALLYNDTAWQPVAPLEASDDDENREDSPAWRREFVPNGLAEQVLDMLEQVVARSRYVPSSACQITFVKGIGKEVLRSVHMRFLKVLQQAETFQDMCSANWAPKVGACICGAHLLEQQIQDAIVPLLLLALHDDVGLSGEPMHAPAGSGQLATAAPAMVAASRVLSRETAAFSACRREWCLKLAKFIAQSFADKAAKYRKRHDAFAEQGSDDHHRTPSPSLVLSLSHLRELLEAMSRVLDADCFRDVWKAVAMATNRLMYNDLATEAKFSTSGAQQFATDCAALVELFGPYTNRPAAHFKELLEASRLLTLPSEAASTLLAAMSKAGKSRKRAEVAKAAIQEAGLMHLKPDMIRAVLLQRM